LKVGPRQVVDRYSNLPGFPEAIRLPSERGQGRKRWKAGEIIAWVDQLERQN
jgi:hypothetical protein